MRRIKQRDVIYLLTYCVVVARIIVSRCLYEDFLNSESPRSVCGFCGIAGVDWDIFVVHNFITVVSEAQRACTRELFSLVIQNIKQRDNSETVDFLKCFNGFFFEKTFNVRDEPAWPDPTMTLLDAVILIKIRRYKVVVLTQVGHRFNIFRVKILIKNLY